MAPVVGIDVGKKRDPTAVCVAEERGDTRPLYLVRFLERLPLGMPYPQLADRVASILRATARRAGAPPIVYVDVTGVGTAFMDQLRLEPTEGARLVPCWFRGGTGERQQCDADYG